MPLQEMGAKAKSQLKEACCKYGVELFLYFYPY